MNGSDRKQRRLAADAMGRMRHLHFVGIGGAGMNGIAQVMLNLGYHISGSDLRENAATRRLAEQGAISSPRSAFSPHGFSRGAS